MRLIKLSLIIACVVIFAACKKEMPKSLSPATTEISGNLANQFELVQGEYPISDVSSEFRFDVKRISEFDSEGTITELGIGYEILDENGNVLDSDPGKPEPLTPMSSCQFLTLKKGETGSAEVWLKGYPDALLGAKTFKISINIKETEE